MRRNTLLVVSLAALLALAGCIGTSGTATTAQPETTQTTTQTGTEYPPGITADGIENGFELTEAHTDALQQHSYKIVKTVSIQTANGTNFETYLQTTKVEGDQFLTSRGYSATAPSTKYDTVSAWTNGETLVVRHSPTDSHNTTTTRTAAGATESALLRSPSEWKVYLYTLLSAGDMSVSKTDAGNVYLSATGDFTIKTPYGKVTPNTLSATVTPAGVIKAVSITYPTTINGTDVVVSKRISFTIGDVSVEKPAWV